MSHDEHDDSDEARRERARARSSLPGRVIRLEDKPDVELVGGTPAERVAMVYELTRRAFAFMGAEAPSYERADAPGRVTRRDDVR